MANNGFDNAKSQGSPMTPRYFPTGSDDAKQELDLGVPTSEDGCHGLVLIWFGFDLASYFAMTVGALDLALIWI
jgi:hypothetical protein